MKLINIKKGQMVFLAKTDNGKPEGVYDFTADKDCTIGQISKTVFKFEREIKKVNVELTAFATEQEAMEYLRGIDAERVDSFVICSNI